jgi:hypothetical protein
LATDKYIPVTGDDWYERRRQDADGEFFRKLADQGPRKVEDGSTRQGIYCLTPGGKLLAYRNGQDADSVRRLLQKGLAEWARLTEAERKAVLPQAKETQPADHHFCRVPPVGGLIVNVYTRMLRQDAKGQLQDSGLRGPEHGLVYGVARDHLWLTRDEWRAFIPADPVLGKSFPAPAAIAERMLRFHLIDNTRGEPPMWRKEDIRDAQLELTVENLEASTLRLRLKGTYLLSAGNPLSSRGRGFEGSVLGYIQFDRQREAITHFDVVALGDHWGHGQYTGGARPGRSPLGVCFELSNGEACADKVPPQAARDSQEYFDTGRHR